MKLYYIPILILFWFLYLQDTFIKSYNEKFFNLMIAIFSFSSFLYLLDLTVFMHGRVFQFFYFFYIFPIYYLFEYFYTKKRLFYIISLFFYISLPFLIKILIVKKQEYNYHLLKTISCKPKKYSFILY